jgi:hypothetical protein
LGAVLQTLRARTCLANGQKEISAEDVQEIFADRNWEYEPNESGQYLGPNYIRKESQLLFIADSVLMSGSSTGQLGELLNLRQPGVQVTTKVLGYARCVIRITNGAGAGALIGKHILPRAVDGQIESEFESIEEIEAASAKNISCEQDCTQVNAEARSGDRKGVLKAELTCVDRMRASIQPIRRVTKISSIDNTTRAFKVARCNWQSDLRYCNICTIVP